MRTKMEKQTTSYESTYTRLEKTRWSQRSFFHLSLLSNIGGTQSQTGKEANNDRKIVRSVFFEIEKPAIESQVSLLSNYDVRPKSKRQNWWKRIVDQIRSFSDEKSGAPEVK